MKFSTVLEELRGTTRPKEKQEVLLKFDCNEFRDILIATFDTFTLFNVKINKKDVPEPGDKDLYDEFSKALSVLNFCEHSKSSKQNKEMVTPFLETLDQGSQELFVCILNKNWKAGVSAKTVNKTFPGLIKQFNVQLANTYKRDYNPHKFERRIVSYKLDGLRCVALRESSDEYYNKGRWTMYSRKGKVFLTVDHLKDQLEALYNRHGWTFFDGELYKHGLPFEAIQGPVMAFKQGQVPEMEYHVFVAGSAEKFLNGEDPNHVDPVSGPPLISAKDINFVNIGFITQEEVEDVLETAFEKGYEGIMLRDPDNLYDYKRSNALLKLKSKDKDENDEGEMISDCVIIDIEYNDNFPVVEDGKLITKRLLNKLWVLQENGVKCKVGSGYNLDFRYKYTNEPEKLIGKIMETLHQGWGNNGRMRFPRKHRVREDL